MTWPFGVDALYVMLAIDDAAAPAQAALASIHAVLGNDPQARAFANLWHLVGSVASGLERLPASQRVQPRYALSVAWNATGLAPVWQRAALFNTAEGRTANDRLDAAMRLFQFADDSTASRDITHSWHRFGAWKCRPILGPHRTGGRRGDIDHAGQARPDATGNMRGYRWSSKTCGRTSPGATPCSVVKTLPSSC